MFNQSLSQGVKLAKILSNSMFPVLQKGDLVLLRKGSIPQKGDLIGFYSSRKIPTVHRLVSQDEEFLYTIADNNTKFDVAIKHGSYLGKVEKVKLSGNWISVQHKLVSFYFFVMQYLSRKITAHPGAKLFSFGRFLAAWQLRFIFWLMAKKRHFSQKLIKSGIQ